MECFQTGTALLHLVRQRPVFCGIFAPFWLTFAALRRNAFLQVNAKRIDWRFSCLAAALSLLSDVVALTGLA
jgi:hypothetical protein